MLNLEGKSSITILYSPKDGADAFNLSATGSIPVFAALGAVTTVQGKLAAKDPYLRLMGKCEQQALIIVYSQETGFEYFVHPDIPVEPLIGMLEILKVKIIGVQATQQATAQQSPILGVNGQPLRRYN